MRRRRRRVAGPRRGRASIATSCARELGRRGASSAARRDRVGERAPRTPAHAAQLPVDAPASVGAPPSSSAATSGVRPRRRARRGRRRAVGAAPPARAGAPSGAAPDHADDAAHREEVLAGGSGAAPHVRARRRVDEPLGAPRRPPPRRRRLDHHPHQRLGARGAHEHPARRRRARPRRRARRRPEPPTPSSVDRPRDRDVAQHLRAAGSSRAAQRRQRPAACGARGRATISPVSSAVAGGRVVGEDDVARLLAAEREVARLHRRRARCGRRPASRRRSMPCARAARGAARGSTSR